MDTSQGRMPPARAVSYPNTTDGEVKFVGHMTAAQVSELEKEILLLELARDLPTFLETTEELFMSIVDISRKSAWKQLNKLVKKQVPIGNEMKIDREDGSVAKRLITIVEQNTVLEPGDGCPHAKHLIQKRYDLLSSIRKCAIWPFFANYSYGKINRSIVDRKFVKTEPTIQSDYNKDDEEEEQSESAAKNSNSRGLEEREDVEDEQQEVEDERIVEDVHVKIARVPELKKDIFLLKLARRLPIFKQALANLKCSVLKIRKNAWVSLSNRVKEEMNMPNGMKIVRKGEGAAKRLIRIVFQKCDLKLDDGCEDVNLLIRKKYELILSIRKCAIWPVFISSDIKCIQWPIYAKYSYDKLDVSIKNKDVVNTEPDIYSDDSDRDEEEQSKSAGKHSYSRRIEELDEVEDEQQGVEDEQHVEDVGHVKAAKVLELEKDIFLLELASHLPIFRQTTAELLKHGVEFIRRCARRNLNIRAKTKVMIGNRMKSVGRYRDVSNRMIRIVEWKSVLQPGDDCERVKRLIRKKKDLISLIRNCAVWSVYAKYTYEKLDASIMSIELMNTKPNCQLDDSSDDEDEEELSESAGRNSNSRDIQDREDEQEDVGRVESARVLELEKDIILLELARHVPIFRQMPAQLTFRATKELRRRAWNDLFFGAKSEVWKGNGMKIDREEGSVFKRLVRIVEQNSVLEPGDDCAHATRLIQKRYDLISSIRKCAIWPIVTSSNTTCKIWPVFTNIIYLLET